MIQLNTFTILLLFYLISSGNGTIAQSRYIDRDGTASFFSEAPLENIEAHSKRAMSLIDIQSGDVVASIAMNSFEFKKSLMQEHFNENYVESHKFPKATFKGRILNLDEINLSNEGLHQLIISGEITIHGVTRPLEVKATLKNKDQNLTAQAMFPLKVADFDIEIPKIVFYNIAEEVEVNLSFTYEPLNP